MMRVPVARILVIDDDPTFFFFSSRRRHTRFDCDWSSDVCSSDLSASWPLLANSTSNPARDRMTLRRTCSARSRSEEHTSELQSQSNLVCRLLLEKKKKRRKAAASHRQVA